MRSALIYSLIIALFAIDASAEANTPQVIAKKVEAFYKDKPDIRVVFKQKVKKPGRRRVLTKQGRVFFKRPGKMRWDYVKPEKVFYISDGSILWSYQPEDALVTRLDVRSSELYHQTKYLFGQGNLIKDFKLSAGTGAGSGQYALQLKPQKSSRNFKSLTLIVDAASGEIRSTRLIDPYDNVSIIEFKKAQYKAVPEKHFKFTPPANATIKDLSKKSGRKKSRK